MIYLEAVMVIVGIIVIPVLFIIGVFVYHKVWERKQFKSFSEKMTDNKLSVDLTGVATTEGLTEMWESNKKRYKDFIETT